MQLTIEITTEIGTNHPELYQFLEETPLFLYSGNGNEVCRTDLEKYLSTIKLQLRNHIITHQKSIAPL